MKNIILSIILSASTVLAAETVLVEKQIKPWYSDVSVSAYGGVEHPNFSKPEWGAGLELAVSPNDKVSILVDAFSFETDNWRDQTVDRVSLLGQYELFTSSNKKFNVYGIGGVGYNFREDNFLLSAGLGVGVNIWKGLSLFADSQTYSEFNSTPGQSSRGGFCWSF